uniref:Golgi apyrase n=1 Tax=Kwoniella pini CBS 10737 TaxID=1296096 RepID=A0A1B9HZN7_9TREE|nr:uncharacterized protein I206_05506 [Kwoniella pini CBS 10737]OCF48725.1 hypothetical protein I206_05506 [Kwoniella pini CBS 10737]
MAPSISTSTTHHALVIDAGSSGSRLQIYSWRDPDLERAEILQEVSQAIKTPESLGKSRWWWKSNYRGKGKESEHLMESKALRRLVRVGKGVEGEDWVKRVEPGISTVRPEEIPQYLAPLLSHALRHIPPSQHSSTPIYILATAGMRLLPESTREAILKASCELIKDEYPFMVEGPSSSGPCGENVRVISGEEEGMWGWVAVNYLMDGFDINHHSPTFGFLDMGGASTQLAFSPSPNEIALSNFPEEELHKIQLRLLSGENVEWPVFVASWLGFGTNKARERYLNYLIENWKIENKDFEISGTEFQQSIKDPCLPLNLEYELKNLDDSNLKGIKIKGIGDFSKCLNNLTPLLEHSKPCPTEHCLFAGLPTPHIDFEKNDQRGFIGISEYWYTSQQVLGLGGIWDWGEWEKGMNSFCSRDWNDIQKQVGDEKGWRGAEVDLSRLQLQCFKGAWISNVLHEGIGIPRLVDAGGNSTLTGGDLGETNEEAERRAREKGLFESSNKKTHFQSMDEIGETAISWTLGKMVIEASKAIQPRSNYKENIWSYKIKNIGGLEDKLQKIGIQTLWAYGFISFFILACLFNFIRKKINFNNNNNNKNQKGKRNRKSSINLINNNLEEGFLSDSSNSIISLNGNGNGRTKFKTIPSKFRLITFKLSNLIKKKLILPFISNNNNNNNSRNNLIPLTNNGLISTLTITINSDNLNPSSTNLTGFFIPGYSNGNLNSNSNSTEINLSTSTSKSSNNNNNNNNSNSPPRKTNSRSGKSRQINSSSSSSFLSSSWEKSLNNSSNGISNSNGVGGGWNDPPSNLFIDENPLSTSIGRSRESTFNNNNNNNNNINTTKAMSRNSSRVNLSELGLAQRSTSRAGTPAFDDNH